MQWLSCTLRAAHAAAVAARAAIFKGLLSAALQAIICANPACSAGAWDKPCVSEMRHQALLPLQRAMCMLTSRQESTYCDEADGEMQLAAMRILANVSWVLEIIDATSLKGGQPTIGTIDGSTVSCQT